MKIKRFNESEQVDISSERIEEMLDNLKQLSSTLDDKGKFVDSLINELNNYKSDSQKGNDQVDDSIAALQVIKKDLGNSLEKTDTVITNLMNYSEEGRKYLYTENK
jgi:ABC-type transporter Mla subunit MlaD